MGLDIGTKTAQCRFGNYCGVHDFRAASILAVIAARPHLKEHLNEFVSADFRIGRGPGGRCPVIYDEMPAATPGHWNLSDDDVSIVDGLLKFVNCSDCDGRWTQGDVVDIHRFFVAMRHHLCRVMEDNTADVADEGEMTRWVNRIADFFEEAAVGGEWIQRG